ncbi:NlpC/P60 family protein [Trujillonella endophytica]|uniref:Cell wall-associated hydrolase, NlpC family n=1 Tax=Trujillonella endophytica TaxID=673521 RepID=A0A1H8PZE2_9ACTN|nr:C40 family peptidase [Trujillella endophytica]SEO47108.1 Cell wall-associated hydrolase, NlpC family [Trujillella endophytica]
MASSPVPTRRRLPGTRTLLVLAAAGGLALGPLPATAAPGDPGPTTSQEAAELLAARGHELEVVTERFNEARELLAQAQADASAAAAAVEAAEASLAAAQERVATVARSAWTGDRLSSLQSMLASSSPDDLLDRVSTLQSIAEHGNGLLGDATRADADAAAARSAADGAADEARDLLDQVAGQQAALDEQVARFQADYDRLMAEEEAARLAAERAAAERAAAEQAAAERAAAEQAAAERAAAERAAAEQAAAGQAAGPPPAPAPAPQAPRPAAPPPPRPVQAAAPAPVAAPASGPAAQVAVDTAMAQLGDPYVWAAAGPNAFDCSGLVQYAYAAAGVAVPHSSRMQSTMGVPVARSQLQPGDLVFFYSPVSHVGIYIGNGQMVHASTYGQPVKVAPVDSMPGYNSARRIA